MTPASELRAWWMAGEWDKLAPAVLACARAVLARFDEAADDHEEFAQATLVRCWLSTTVPEKPREFVATTAINVWRSAIRRAHRRRGIGGTTAERVLRGIPDDGPAALAAIIRQERERRRTRAITRALSRVPAHEREALRLHYLRGLPVRDVAQRTRASEGCIKMRLKRGRDRLATFAALRAVA